MPNIWNSRGQFVGDTEGERQALRSAEWEPAPYRARPSRPSRPTAAQDFATPIEEPAMTEQHAENLYGPAPTGDEDPHASQAVPDPEEASGPRRHYLPVRGTILAMGVCGVHLGQRVLVTEGDRTVTGKLTAVDHRANWLSETPLCSKENSLVLGQRYVVLHFGNMEVNVLPEATVELLD